MIERVKEFLLSNHESKYPILAKKLGNGETPTNEKIHYDIAGYREKVNNVWHFYTFSTAYKKMLGGMSESEANKILSKAGILISAKNRAQKEKTFPIGKQKYYLLKLDEEDGVYE